jgi:hypothetical protein
MNSTGARDHVKFGLEAGDRNTKYFHQKAKQRTGQKYYQRHIGQQWPWCEDEDGMGEIAVKYFNDIFSSSAGLEVEEPLCGLLIESSHQI